MAFGNRSQASFVRLSQAKEAPNTITWGRYNRRALIRLPIIATDENGRSVSPETIEFRLPDGTAHPYLLLAGIAQAMTAGRSIEHLDALIEKTSAQTLHSPYAIAVPRTFPEVVKGSASIARCWKRAACSRGTSSTACSRRWDTSSARLPWPVAVDGRRADCSRSAAEPARVQLRPAIAQEEPPRVGVRGLVEIEIRVENRFDALRRARQHASIRPAHERFACERHVLFDADAVAERREIPVLERGDAHLGLVQPLRPFSTEPACGTTTRSAPASASARMNSG